MGIEAKQKSRSKRQRAPRRIKLSTLLIAIGAQVAIGLALLFIVVLQPEVTDEPSFQAERSAYISQDNLDRKTRVAEMKRRLSKPDMMERMAVDQLFSEDLPAVPKLPENQMTSLNSADMLFETDPSVWMSFGVDGAFSDVGGGKSATTFFGIEDEGERIVIVVNTSASVMRKAKQSGVSLVRIHKEMSDLIASLSSGTLFGIVHFSQGRHRLDEDLIPASAANKNFALSWIGGNAKGNPPVASGDFYPGHEGALKSALELEPDIIYLLTDGVLNKRTPKSSGSGYSYPKIAYSTLQGEVWQWRQESGRDTRIHVIGFGLKEGDRKDMQGFVQSTGGSFKEM